MAEYLLPDVGEGLTEAEIVAWKVKVGDVIAINDIVVEIETAKSLVELPSPYAGTVLALLVEEGETIPVGTPIISVGDPSALVEPVESTPGRPRRRRRRRPRWRSTCPTRARAAAGRARAWSAATRPSAARSVAPAGRLGGHPRAGAERLRARSVAGGRGHRRARGAGHVGADRRRRCRRAGQAAGAQARQGPRRRPDRRRRHRPGRHRDPRRRRVRRQPGVVRWERRGARSGRRRAGRPRVARAGQGRAQDDGGRDGAVRVQRPARDRVGDHRRDPHDGVRRPAQEAPRVPRRQGLPAARPGARGDAGDPPDPRDQLLVGRGLPGGRLQVLRQPGHRGGHAPRPGGPQRQGRRVDVACSSSRAPSTRSPRPPATAGPSRPR